jgi:hypothetical protein
MGGLVMRKLLTLPAASKFLGLDKRTLERKAVEPVGSIMIHGKEFKVYDKAGIEKLKQLMDEIQAE